MLKNIFFLFLVFTSCNKNDSNDKKFSFINVCDLIDSLNYKDNLYRSDPRILDPFFKILDSIRLSEGISIETYAKFSVEKQLDYGEKARAIANRLPPINKILDDSLMHLQSKLDDENTETLISYINEKGYYPSSSMTGCNTQPDLIFRHSNPKYFKDIKLIIDKQLKKGHINEYQYIVYNQHFERVLSKVDTALYYQDFDLSKKFSNLRNISED